MITPNQLADALESGEYTRHKRSLSKTPTSKKNCCLGVATRLANNGTLGEDAFDQGYPTTETINKHFPWLDANSALTHALVNLNDSKTPGVWKTTTAPILRLIKVRKDGRLDAKQHPIITLLIGGNYEGENYEGDLYGVEGGVVHPQLKADLKEAVA